MLTPALLCLLAYLVGSVPSGYLLVRAIRRVDVRHYGSHSIGAINVCRVGGISLGAVTLCADAGKAFGIVLLVGLAQPSPWVTASAGLLAMIGHAYSLWLFLAEGRFSEGKSVASGLGVALGLSLLGAFPWRVAVAPVAVWGCGLIGPRLLTGRWSYISPVTMAAAVSLPIAVVFARPQAAHLYLSVAMAALILVRHRNNVRRLVAGTEPRLGDRLPEGRPADADGGRALSSGGRCTRTTVQIGGGTRRRWMHHDRGRDTARRWAHLRPLRS